MVSPVLSQFYQAEHQRHGVDILLGVRLQELLSQGSEGTQRVAAVRLRLRTHGLIAT